MMQVKITSDSTCDLSPELLEQYGIDLIPLNVVLGDRTRKDGIDISPDDIFAYADAVGILPKTSASNASEYADFFSQFVSKGQSVVHFCLGSKFSSSYQNACHAAEECGNVYVVDSENLSTGQGLLVLKGAEMAISGYSAESIYASCCKAVERVEASFVIDSLDYLYKGGRCSALAAFGGSILKLKPCIEVRQGVMLPVKKYRGNIDRVIMQYVEDRLRNRTDIDTHRIFVTHTQCSDPLVHRVIERIRELLPDADLVLETTTSATITSHCGPNTLGVLFLRNR